MVASIGVINPSNVEATAYISAVAAFAVVVLVLLLFLGRRWCYTAVFTRKCCDDILAVNAHVAAPCLPLDNAQFDALSKPNHYPERIFTFEASDSDEELRLRIQQDKEEVECHYEEKNENAAAPKLDVELVENKLRETSLRETALRETRIDEVVPKRAEYIHTLEAQSSVDSDVIAHNVRVVLMPLKKQKYKSKIRNGENPQYMESFVFHKINPEDVHGLGLRIRVYGCERMRRQRLLGEATVSFASLSLEMENGMWIQLTPRQHHPSLQVSKVALFQLTEVTLMVSVWWRRSVKRNEMVGWFSLGHSPSGREEERHWQELCERQGEQCNAVLHGMVLLILLTWCSPIKPVHVCFFSKYLDIICWKFPYSEGHVSLKCVVGMKFNLCAGPALARVAGLLTRGDVARGQRARLSFCSPRPPGPGSLGPGSPGPAPAPC
ncbi:hypothetical protein HF086_001047 [Spodoptera exigua]|uniref:C2 domain-containing protein n=1 Tax=Spodoptera exigua TaxID=7107 RepID=A0A922M6M8_SPOEX|nr:hypothetical protein HF086_001047 [Spodoptera exigua]